MKKLSRAAKILNEWTQNRAIWIIYRVVETGKPNKIYFFPTLISTPSATGHKSETGEWYKQRSADDHERKLCSSLIAHSPPIQFTREKNLPDANLLLLILVIRIYLIYIYFYGAFLLRRQQFFLFSIWLVILCLRFYESFSYTEYKFSVHIFRCYAATETNMSCCLNNITHHTSTR